MDIVNYTDFQTLFNDVAKMIEEKSEYGNFQKLTGWHSYSPNRDYIGYVSVGNDDGDVDAYVCEDSRANKDFLLAEWNILVDKFNREVTIRYPDDINTFVMEWWLPMFAAADHGATVDVTLWG